MLAPKYNVLYSIPQDIIYPTTPNIRLDTNFPNLNSEDYSSRESTKTALPPFLDFIDSNSNQNIIIAANDTLNREPDGVVLGYSSIQDFKDGQGKPLFEFRREATITGMHFMRHNLIVLTLESGLIELWSTRCDNSDSNNYCPFKLTGKSLHFPTITSSGFIDDSYTKFVTGDQRGNILVWDTGAADLDRTEKYNFYRSEITGICSSNQNENVFLSCSGHGESYITDIRTNDKGTLLRKDHENIFTTISSKENFIFIGDFSGNLKVLDQRKSNEEIHSLEIFGNSIKRIKPQKEGKNIVALERGTGLKVVSIEGFDTIYESTETNSLRDALWIDDSTIQVIGWNSLFKTHKFGMPNGK